MSEPGWPEIPGYRILARAGQGGMGVVYRAEQVTPRRLVALKLLLKADVASLARFQREAETIARLEHPHILPVYDFGLHLGRPFLVMRYVDGGSLADRLRQGPVTVAMAAQWLASLAGALDLAHEAGVVHRDVKASNVLLDSQSQVYLTDFGIAVAGWSGVGPDALPAALNQADAARPAVPLGSAAIMAPEQIRGAALDARTDVYALAVLAYQMLTGRLPYEAETAMGLLVRHLQDPIPEASAANPSVSPALSAVIGQGMAKAAADRPPSAGAFAAAFQHAALEAPAARPPRTRSAPRPPRRVRRRAPWLIGFVALAFCLVGVVGLGAVAWVLYGWAGVAATSPTPPAAIATTPERLETAVARDLLRDDFSRPNSGFALAQDADGGVAYTAGGLQLTVLTAGVEWFSPSQRLDVADVAIDVTAALQQGEPGGFFGLFCRWRGATDYLAVAWDPAGEIALWRERSGELTYLHPWAPAGGDPPVVNQSHRLLMRCHGEQIQVAIDGVPVIEVVDPAPIPGDIGFVAGLRRPGSLIVVFDELKVSAP